MDSTSFYFNNLYINQQYQNDTYTYYITHIDIKNTYKSNTTYSGDYFFNARTIYPITCIPLSEDKVAYIDIHFIQQPRATQAPTNKNQNIKYI